MSITLQDTTDQQGLIEHLKFITGQDSLHKNDAVRLINFAIDDYSYLALTSSGRWKFDDSTNTDLPIATATLNAGETSIPLETDFLTIEQVQLDGNILVPIDNNEYRTITPTELYGTGGTPGYYDYDSHSLFFYPIPGSAHTVTVLYSRASPYFDVDDTTAAIGIPRIHHEYLALHAAHRLSLRTNDTNRNELRNELVAFEERIRDFYSKRDKTSGRKLRAKINVPK